jgi:hypothetical protein
MKSPSTVSCKVAVVGILAASYLPPLVGLVCGVGHCDTCRRAWLEMVWMVQGVMIPVLGGTYLFHRSVFFGGSWGIVVPILVQISWLASWIWLAKRGKAWLVFSAIAVLALSTIFAYSMYAMIRA